MNTALILSGGTGTRLGADIPKQYLMAGGKPLIAYCIETLSMHDMIDTIWIVADAAWQERLINGCIKPIEIKNSEDFPSREQTGSYPFFMDLRIFVSLLPMMTSY